MPAPDGFHPPLEEYLEAVLELEEESDAPVIQARLAERLGYSAPTVSETVRRLKAEGYLLTKGRALSLTKKGRAVAESVVRKHRLAERLLTDVIGLAWHKAHIEACRWEHVISDEVEELLVQVLGHPSTCPHGNPIPGADVPDRTLVALADAQPGDRVRLERITEQVEIDTESLTYLGENGLIPGAEARVQARAPDGSLTVQLDHVAIAVSPALASQIYVTEAESLPA